jgi:hypothetical protein
MKTLYRIFHYISCLASWVLIFAILFLLQEYTIGLIPGFNQIVVLNTFYLHELLFLITSIFIIIKFVKVNSPWSKYLKDRR